jgi:hypothetical protein
MKICRTLVIPLVMVTVACDGERAAEPEAVAVLTGALHGTASLNFAKTADWGAGYNARVDITNTGANVIQGWSTELDMPKNVQVNVSGLPPCGPGVSDNCWLIFSDIGPENILRVLRTDSSNVINPGQTQSIYLYGSYEGAFGFPTRCRAPHDSTPVACNGSADATAPTVPTNVRIFGTGSTLVDLLWDPATDAAGVTGYIIRYATQAAPALEIGEVPATLPVTRARITRLVSDTNYIFFVEARDAAGNVSSPLASSPSTRTLVPGMSVTFATVNTWPGGGFQGEFRITNNESLPLDNWRITFSFTGSFQSVWDGVLGGGAGGSFTISAPAHNIRLDPGETAVVGATGTFGTPPTPPGGFAVFAGNPSVRALATPQPPCLGVMCPSGTHCEVPQNGIPTCVSN